MNQKDNKNYKHGMHRHPLYRIYNSMKSRCYTPTHQSYSKYGGKGVRMCDEWLNDKTKFFEWALANGWESGMRIDKDIKAHKLGVEPNIYSPDMCSVVTPKQNSNCRVNSRFIEYNGEIKTMMEWSEHFGIHVQKIWNRLNRGWSVDATFTIPHEGRRKTHNKY